MKKKTPSINEIAKICSTCGNCLYSCPVYNAELMEPNSPRGKINLIKSLMDGRLKPGGVNRQFMYQCLLCGSCRHICPKGVEFVELMVKYRNLISGGRKIPFFKKIVLFLYQSVLFRRFLWVVDILAKTGLRKRLSIPRRLKSSKKDLYTPAKQGGKYDILLFPGCVLTYFYPALIEKTVAFLEQQGFSVAVPKGLHCCGFPYISQGWSKKFDSLKKKNLEIFSRFDYQYLVVPCSTGVMAFKNYYDFALPATPSAVESSLGTAPAIPAIYELTEFVYQFAREAKVNPGWKKNNKITYHDPCHDLKMLGIETEPRFFMKLLGENFIDDTSALCCGFGGIFSVGFPATSKKILARKVGKLDEMDVQTVVTSCPGCFFQLREHLSQDVKFFIELF